MSGKGLTCENLYTGPNNGFLPEKVVFCTCDYYLLINSSAWKVFPPMEWVSTKGKKEKEGKRRNSSLTCTDQINDLD
jgi:hypothetical protein